MSEGYHWVIIGIALRSTVRCHWVTMWSTVRCHWDDTAVIGTLPSGRRGTVTISMSSLGRLRSSHRLVFEEGTEVGFGNTSLVI